MKKGKGEKKHMAIGFVNSCSRSFRAAWLIVCLGSGMRAGQTHERVVKANDPAQITDAVMITDITVGGKSIQCGLFTKPPAVLQPVTSFQADGDWLRQMTIVLFNRTERTIVSGVVLLRFGDTGDCRTQPCVAPELHLGQMPMIAAYDGRTGMPLKPEHPERAPLDWKPGQTISVRLSDYMDEIEASLADHLPVSAVNQVDVHIGPFFLQSGMRWSGRYSVPDPDHPGKFRYLPETYFPGKMSHNWPPGYDR